MMSLRRMGDDVHEEILRRMWQRSQYKDND